MLVPMRGEAMNLLQTASLLALASLALTGCGDDGNGGGGTGGGGGSGSIDACAIVTQEDATALFGLEAQPDPASLIPGMAGHCKWEAESASGGQYLSFSVWNGEGYYSMPTTTDTQPYAIGDKGHIKSADAYGVSIMWIQNGLVPDLYHFTLGPSGGSTPEATTKVEQLKTLAQKASAALP
jgi:hypothetical protein